MHNNNNKYQSGQVLRPYRLDQIMKTISIKLGASTQAGQYETVRLNFC